MARPSRACGYICPMPEDATTVVELPIHHRVRLGVTSTENWLQLIRFAGVGVSGYVVNLVVYALLIHVVGIDYKVAAVVAYVVSVLNNFWWNRHWTFSHRREAHPVEQGLKFFAVSLVTFGFSYLILVGLVEGAGMTKVLAQAIAVAAATPLNFVGQKLWSFRA